jgi:hypothetical protein
LGVFTNTNHAPKMVASVTSPLWEIDVFAELLVQYESDLRFSWTLTTCTASLKDYDEHWFLTPTAGLSYRNEDWDFFLSRSVHLRQPTPVRPSEITWEIP